MRKGVCVCVCVTNEKLVLPTASNFSSVYHSSRYSIPTVHHPIIINGRKTLSICETRTDTHLPETQIYNGTYTPTQIHTYIHNYIYIYIYIYIYTHTYMHMNTYIFRPQAKYINLIFHCLLLFHVYIYVCACVFVCVCVCENVERRKKTQDLYWIIC